MAPYRSFRFIISALVLAAASLTLLHVRARAAIAQPSKLYINLAAVPLDKYQFTNWDSTFQRPYVKNCSTTKTVRQCIQDRLVGFRSQGAEGVRFFYPLCGGGYNTALNNCGSSPSQVSLNTVWVSNLNLFLFDMKTKGFTKVIPSPMFWGAWEPTDPNPQNPANPGAPNDGQRKLTVSDSCAGNPSPTGQVKLVFWPAVPFGVSGGDNYPGTSTPQPVGPWRPGHNQSYNCSPANPVFVGWSNIYAVSNAVLQKAQANSLIVDEFDIQNEIALDNATVYGRLIVDNKHTGTGNPNVLSQTRSSMTTYGFNWKRVTYSAHSANSTVSQYDCGSVYGDSARIIRLSEMLAGIGGGLIGDANGASWVNGLRCGGTATGMYQMPTYHSPPNITDLHVYACVEATTGGCTSASVQNDAKKTFDGVKAMIDSYGPSGWRGSVPDIYNSLYMLGETWSNAFDSSNKSCEGGNVTTSVATQTVNGFNTSGLAGRTAGTVFQPWHQVANWGDPAACYPATYTINPPYTPQP